MADVFISYASDDREKAQKLAGALEACGWSVWWDRKIIAGQIFDEVIEHELGTAKCVVVLWSGYSVSSEWVKNEATTAAERNILVPVLINAVKLPLEFRRRQTIDLVDWDEDTSYGGFKALHDSISANISDRATPQLIAPPPSGFHWNRRLTLASIAAITIAFTGLLLMPLNSSQRNESNIALPNLAYGVWTLHDAIDNDGNNWNDSTFQFTSQQETVDGLEVGGTITWRLNFAEVGTEQFIGHYLSRNRQVILEGVSVSSLPDASNSLAVGSYSAVLSLDERELSDGRWGSTMKHEPGVPGKWNASR